MAVKPRSASARYFTTVEQPRSKGPQADQDSWVTRAGATGVQPSFGTLLRYGRALVRDPRPERSKTKPSTLAFGQRAVLLSVDTSESVRGLENGSSRGD